MKERCPGISLLFCLFSLIVLSVHSQHSPDVSAMQALKASLGNTVNLYLKWSHPNPCNWKGVTCLDDRVTHILIRRCSLEGILPPDIKNLTSLTVLDVSSNNLSGPIPSLSGLTSLEEAYFISNNFSYIPSDFFRGLTSLKNVNLGGNPFSLWEIPESLKDAKHLQNFNADSARISGTIPNFLGGDTFPELEILILSSNYLQGKIPHSFAESSIQVLGLNSQMSEFKLNGSVAVLENLISLTHLHLDHNNFTGPLPDLSRLRSLMYLSLENNQFTGVVPASLLNLPKLVIVNLANNLLQGPTPEDVETGSNSFCVGDPGVACDSRVNILLSIAESMNYPAVFAQSWKGNEPCSFSQKWKGITCDQEGNVTAVDFQNLGLSGAISSNFSLLKSLEKLILSNNSLTGIIPNELATLSRLEKLDVSTNQLYGNVPNFRQNVTVNTSGNPAIGIDGSFPPVGTPLGGGGHKSSKTQAVVGIIIGAVCGLFVLGLGVYLYTRKPKYLMSCFKSSNGLLIHPQDEENGNGAKNTTSGWNVKGVEFGNMTIIPIQVLRNATNNFNEENIVGRGGFSTVYKGELNSGTIIAVKRMESGLVTEKGLGAFKFEIEVLSNVRHRHLLALIGYCPDGNERLLVYEYMPQGTLHRHLFKWKEEGLKPLEWSRRLTIALDVARGVEYLHGLANQSFIHRDLKPSNILLGDDMRAKVADFGLVRLVPENFKSSIETRVAGTFGYLAPEYVVTGRVTAKVDVFSFGVILMELITGRKAVDHSTHSEDVVHLVTWLRNMHIKHDTIQEAIDQTIELDEATFASISRVAELADHCCATDPHQRPDMVYVVSVLSSLAGLWRPVEVVSDNIATDHLDMTSSSSSSSHSFTSESVTSPNPVMMESSFHSLNDDCHKVVFNE